MEATSFSIELKGDKIIHQIPSIRDKALRINLNENKTNDIVLKIFDIFTLFYVIF